MSYFAHDHSGNSLPSYHSFLDSIDATHPAHFAVSSTSPAPAALCGEDASRGHPPRRRMEANARERDRTCNLNSAYQRLRELIPTEPRNRRLSKIEILRLAMSYIDHLDNERQARESGAAGQGSCCRSGRVCTFCLTKRKRSDK